MTHQRGELEARGRRSTVGRAGEPGGPQRGLGCEGSEEARVRGLEVTMCMTFIFDSVYVKF